MLRQKIWASGKLSRHAKDMGPDILPEKDVSGGNLSGEIDRLLSLITAIFVSVAPGV